MTDPKPGVDDVVDHRRVAQPRHERFDFAAQFESSYRVLWVVAAGVLGRREGVEDVIQEAVVRALRRIDQFAPGTDFTAWMAQIVRFVALNGRRGAGRRRSVSLETCTQVESIVSTGEGHRQPVTATGEIRREQADFDDELLAALGDLAEIARSCLLLRTVENLSYDEIAGVLAIPPGTAMSHVHRSRKHLREILGRREGCPPCKTDLQDDGV